MERERRKKKQDSYNYVPCAEQEVTGHGFLEFEHLRNKMDFNYQHV